MTDVIFSFDTEDYVNACGADGILDVATVLRDAGHKGCFNIVGWLAERIGFTIRYRKSIARYIES